jgi:uncharacterized protein YukJ
LEFTVPLENYGVLKGTPLIRRLGTGSNPHYQIHVVDDSTDYRIAVNVDSALSPSEVEYLVDADFQHPFLTLLDELDRGWHPLESKPGGPALDFIRSNLFDPRNMVPLPFNTPGPDNDLNEKIDYYIQRAMGDDDALIYAFGAPWGPETGKKDKTFGFLPGNGVHDIHMKQANVGRFTRTTASTRTLPCSCIFRTRNNGWGYSSSSSPKLGTLTTRRAIRSGPRRADPRRIPACHGPSVRASSLRPTPPTVPCASWRH